MQTDVKRLVQDGRGSDGLPESGARLVGSPSCARFKREFFTAVPKAPLAPLTPRAPRCGRPIPVESDVSEQGTARRPRTDGRLADLRLDEFSDVSSLVHYVWAEDVDRSPSTRTKDLVAVFFTLRIAMEVSPIRFNRNVVVS